MIYKTSLLSLCVAASFAVSAEQAQEIERVLVYGALAPTPLSEMASSISVLSEQAIAERNAQHLQDLLNRAANVNFTAGASRGRFVQIRGIGERSQFVDPVSPSVGFMFDGIDYSGLLIGANTFDIQQIEVFKGPNSARFGAEGLAGMINMLSGDASEQTEVSLLAGLANYNSWQLGAAVGGALTDELAGRFSVHQDTSDGFIDNIHLGRQDTNNIDELSARGKLAWQASDALNVKLTWHYIDADNGYDAFSLNRNRTTLSDMPGFDRQKSDALALDVNYQGLEWANVSARLTNLSADLGYGYDEDWSYPGIKPGWEYASTDHYLRDRSDQSLQIRLTGKGNRNWVLGAYLINKDEDLRRQYTYLSNDFTSNNQRKDYALYGQYQHDLSERSWLKGSLRVAKQSLDYLDSNQILEAQDETNIGGELSYHVRVNQQSMLYTSVTRSYKAGGVNGEALGRVNDPAFAAFKQTLQSNATFDAETLLGTEFGVKGASADGSLQVDFAVFYQWRDNVQFKSWIEKDQAFVGFYNNAPDGSNYGIEASINKQVNDSVRWFANLGWLKTRLNDFTRQGDGQVVVIEQRDQAQAPRYQVNLGVAWQIIPDLEWLVEVDGKDEYYYSNSHDQQADNLQLVHTNLSYQWQEWLFSLYVRNLFDKDYGTRGFYFGNDPRDQYTPHLWEQLGEPRRIGVTARYQF